MATLTTTFQKVCEVSRKLSSNLTGYTRLYMRYDNRSGLNDTIYYEIRQQAVNPSGNYFGWQWDTALAWSIKSGNTNKANGSFTQSAIYSNGKEVVRASGSYVQPHNADGTFSDTLTFSAPIYNSTYSTTGDITLPNIAVNPTLTITSVSNMTTSGSSVKYTLGSTNGRSTKVQYSTNGTTWVDWKTKTADNTYTETLPNLLSSYKDSYTNTIYFRAIIGNYSSGSKSKQFSIDSSIKPSISSVTVTAVNDKSALGSLFVQNLTTPKITTSASAYANGGATLKQYDLTALGGYNSSISKTNVGNNYTYSTKFQKSGSYTATIKVIDTRGGNVSKSSASFTVIPYSNPSIQSIKVERCNSDGTLNNNGTSCKLTVKYNIAPINDGTTNKNTKALSYSTDNSNYIDIPISNYSGTVSKIINDVTFNVAQSYPIYIKLTDITTTVNQNVTLPTSFVLESKRAGGKGITYGAIAEQDNLHYYMDAYFNNNTYVNNRLLNQLGSYMKGTMTDDYIIQQAGTVETLPIDTSYAKVGNLTNSNNGIRIGAGIHTVLVSGNIYLYTNVPSTGSSIGYIYKNNQNMCTVNIRNSGNYLHLALPTITLSVTEGDIIYLKINTPEALLVKNYQNGTFLNVTVLN